MEIFLRDGVVGWSAILQHHPFAGGRIRWLTTSSCNVRSLWDTGSNFRAWWNYGHEQGDNGRRGGGWRFPSWKKGTAKLMEKTSKLVMNSWIESLKSSKFDEKNQRTLPRQAQVPEVSVPAEQRPWKAQMVLGIRSREIRCNSSVESWFARIFVMRLQCPTDVCVFHQIYDWCFL